MINIAIIDDELTEYMLLSTQVNRWAAENHHIVNIQYLSAFHNSMPVNSFDAIFLDIQLKDCTMNGLDIARILRRQKYEGSIIFTTNYQEYVYDGYDVSALAYLLKPINYEKLSKCMFRIHNTKTADFLYFKIKSDTYKYRFNDILYIESSLHYITIYGLSTTFKLKKSLSSISSVLPTSFKYCFRSIIVNCSQIQSISTKACELILSNGTKLPISKTFMTDIQQIFSGFII